MNVNSCMCPEAQRQSPESLLCIFEVVASEGNLRLYGARQLVWGTHLDFNSGLADLQIQRDPYCLFRVEVGIEQNQGIVFSGPVMGVMACYPRPPPLVFRGYWSCLWGLLCQEQVSHLDLISCGYRAACLCWNATVVGSL